MSRPSDAAEVLGPVELAGGAAGGADAERARSQLRMLPGGRELPIQAASTAAGGGLAAGDVLGPAGARCRTRPVASASARLGAVGAGVAERAGGGHVHAVGPGRAGEAASSRSAVAALADRSALVSVRPRSRAPPSRTPTPCRWGSERRCPRRRAWSAQRAAGPGAAVAGGGQPDSSGENMAATRSSTSSTTAATASTVRLRARCRPGVPVRLGGISVVGCDAQLMRAPYGRLSPPRKQAGISMQLHGSARLIRDVCAAGRAGFCVEPPGPAGARGHAGDRRFR